MIYAKNNDKGGKNDRKAGVVLYLMNGYKPQKGRYKQSIKSVDLKNNRKLKKAGKQHKKQGDKKGQ